MSRDIIFRSYSLLVAGALLGLSLPGSGMAQTPGASGIALQDTLPDFSYHYEKVGTARHIHDPIQLLQGRMAGLMVSKAGSNPNGRFDVRLRGLTTLFTDEQPLVVIDGIPGVPLSMLDPEDIQHIDLNTGVTAARWGFRGGGGIIRVQTKALDQGSPAIKFRSYLAMERPGRRYDVLDASAYQRKELEYDPSYEPPSSENNNWANIITRRALSSVSNLSITGGSPALRYRGSLSWRTVEGIALNTGYDKLSGRAQLRSTLLEDQLDLSLNIAGHSSTSDIGFRDAFKYAISFNPAAPKRADNNQFGGYYQLQQFDYYNPLAILEQNEHDGEDQIWNGRFSATYSFSSPGKDGFTASLLLSETRADLFRGEFSPAESYYEGYSSNGFARTQTDDKINRFADLHIDWSGNLGEGLELSTQIGHSLQYMGHEYRLKEADEIPEAEGYSIISEAGVTALEGYETTVEENHLLSAFYGTVRISSDQWFLDAGLRYERSSNLPAHNEWGAFPYMQAGYDLNDILNLPFVRQLQLHAGYGVAGNLPPNSNWFKDVYEPSGYIFQDGKFVQSYSQTQGKNPDLKWESTRMWNGGLDFVSTGGRLQGRAEYFHHKSSDIIINAETPVPPYPAPSQYINMGAITNRGFELSLKYHAVRQSEFSYTTGINVSTINTVYKSLSNGFYSMDGQFRGYPSGPCGCSISFIKIQEGEELGQFNGPKFVGINADGEWILEQADDRNNWQNIGNGLPSSTLGWSHNVGYRNWDLDLLLTGAFGHDLVSVTRLLYENNTLGVYNILESARNDIEEFNQWSSYFVEDGDYLRLENVTLSYAIPVGEGSPFKRAKVFLGLDNLFTITGYSGIDPTPRLADRGQFFVSNGSLPSPQRRDLMAPGIDRPSTWLNTRTILMGVDFRF